MDTSYHVEWPSKRLIINADDYGCSRSISQAILDLAQNDKISSLTAMVNMPFSPTAAQLYIQNKKYTKASVGLHFNITEGKPLSQPIKNSKVVQNGVFIGHKLFNSVLKEQLECLGSKVIRQEVLAQIKEFIRLYRRRPTHIDGHNHIHVIPVVAQQVASIMAEIGIYRTRIPIQELSASATTYMRQSVTNAHMAQKIYSSQGIIWPNAFIGMESSGNLSQALVRQALQSKEQVCLELMCHPGRGPEAGNHDEVPFLSSQLVQQQVPVQTGPSHLLEQHQKQKWNHSIERLRQKQQLQNQFQKVSSQLGKLSRYDEFESGSSSKPFRLLIYSKLQHGSGNYTSTLRYKTIFQSLGFEVYLRSVESQITLEEEARDLQFFLLRFRISLILGVNIARTGLAIVSATGNIGVPYFLILAGTDVNLCFKDDKALLKHKQCLEGALSVISMSAAMLKQMQCMCSRCQISSKFVLIPQSSSSVSFNSTVPTTKNVPQKPYILLPTSFRRVKAVHYLFEELNQLIDKEGWEVLIAGPIIGQQREYYDYCSPRLGKIKYLGVLSREQYFQYLSSAFCVLNCSESEGMSCSILEAFQARVPVIARNIQGNSQLVTNRVNGLLFETPSQFMSCLRQLKQNSHFRQQIVSEASRIFKKRYSPQQEMGSFRELIIGEFHRKMLMAFDKCSMLRVFNREFCHHTSAVNNQLFQQIPVQYIQETKQLVRVMDMGCGTAVFSLFFLNTLIHKAVDLYLVDISSKAIANAIYNILQSRTRCQIRSITCIRSDLFSNIPESVQFDVVLCNPPQCPFQIQSSRLDKNGGQQGFKFYRPLIQWLSQRNRTSLYLLHSWMADTYKLKGLIKESKLQIGWQSERRRHRIEQSAYEQMEVNLSVYLIEHAYSGKAQIVYEDGVFLVPAVIYRIQHR